MFGGGGGASGDGSTARNAAARSDRSPPPPAASADSAGVDEGGLADFLAPAPQQQASRFGRGATGAVGRGVAPGDDPYGLFTDTGAASSRVAQSRARYDTLFGEEVSFRFDQRNVCREWWRKVRDAVVGWGTRSRCRALCGRYGTSWRSHCFYSERVNLTVVKTGWRRHGTLQKTSVWSGRALPHLAVRHCFMEYHRVMIRGSLIRCDQACVVWTGSRCWVQGMHPTALVNIVDRGSCVRRQVSTTNFPLRSLSLRVPDRRTRAAVTWPVALIEGVRRRVGEPTLVHCSKMTTLGRGGVVVFSPCLVPACPIRASFVHPASPWRPVCVNRLRDVQGPCTRPDAKTSLLAWHFCHALCRLPAKLR